MDTLLDQQMPLEWTRPGNGPTITYNSVSGDFKGIGTNIDHSVSGVFFNGGNGFNNRRAYAAQLHFADVTDQNNVGSLDSGHGVSPLSGENQEGANRSTEITFAGVANAIKTLEDAGYTLVGASYGNKTSGTYTGSDLADNAEYASYDYGSYGDSHGQYDLNNVLTHNFTLNFVRKTTPTTPPTTPVTPPTTPDTPPTTPDTPPTTPNTPPTTPDTPPTTPSTPDTPVTPDTPTTPSEPDTPSTPEEPSLPNEPTSTPTATPKPTVEPVNNQQPVATSTQQLPQTGNHSSIIIAALGIVLGMFGLGLARKKNN